MIEIRNLRHTPGPWLPVRFDFGKLSFWTVITKDGRLTEKGLEGEANARLQALAPELLDALWAMTRNFKPFTLRPMGGEGSQARLEQEEQNRVHAQALQVLAKVMT